MLKSLSRAAHLAARLSGKSAAVPGISISSISPFSRSIWSRCHNGAASGYRPKLLTSKRLLPSASCGCGALHTDGDKAFTEFLTDEIKEEKKIQKSKTLPKISGGWELELNSTEAKLVRSISGEKVTVTFNVNNSIPPQLEEEPEQTPKGPEHEPDIVSTPNFVVEVTKQGATNSLVFDCHFPEDETSGGEEERDIFAIREVSFQPEGDADWKETSYTLNTDSLDWALYDHLMDFLSDRGVDNTFAHELIELSTSLEHQEYIKFLEDLSRFIKCK
ncbi:complement component 1 Q subcomponent-binding protein, mitochondrial-like isoform X2 [Myxocyprinus asiaticus]|uniref:complement component 1 Q subcomponent-binding protein, mitochondrial-like isoform X2 n=1 Tax=Myxocyprinus asiaticus TaxID=70543 RepID=UPI002221F7A0|nr:complement component 1 Q subcomponent-binding protein, mitochondrial-like isoform X2 [Myxocyprinus asiaticus]